MTDFAQLPADHAATQPIENTYTWQIANGAIHIVVRDGVCYVNGSPVTPASPEKDKQ
jgi:hypothetical protein